MLPKTIGVDDPSWVSSTWVYDCDGAILKPFKDSKFHSLNCKRFVCSIII